MVLIILGILLLIYAIAVVVMYFTKKLIFSPYKMVYPTPSENIWRPNQNIVPLSVDQRRANCVAIKNLLEANNDKKAETINCDAIQ